MEDCIRCEGIGGGSPRHLNTFSDLFIVAVHYTHNNTAAIKLYKVLDMPYLASIVCCTHIRSATASFEDLVTLHRRTLQQIF